MKTFLCYHIQEYKLLNAVYLSIRPSFCLVICIKTAECILLEFWNENYLTYILMREIKSYKRVFPINSIFPKLWFLLFSTADFCGLFGLLFAQ